MADNITPRGFVYGIKKPDDDRQENRIIESLFFNHLANRIKLESLEFKRALIEHTLEAFGTDNFLEWYYNQYNSPYLSDVHLDFLRDTIGFIYGKPRKYFVEVWDDLLDRTDIKHRPIHKELIEREFFGITETHIRPVLVEDVIKEWATKENGLADMLYTLFLLFGKRYDEKVSYLGRY